MLHYYGRTLWPRGFFSLDLCRSMRKTKELIFCRKLKFSHTYIFATWRWKYERSTTLDCKDIGMDKFEFVAETHFLCREFLKKIKKLSSCQKFKFLIPPSLQFWFLKLRLFYLTYFIVWTINGLRHRVAKIYGVKMCLCAKGTFPFRHVCLSQFLDLQ